MLTTARAVAVKDAAELSAVLMEYARQIEQLAPSSRHPERFHENKSEIAHALRCLASEVRPAGRLPSNGRASVAGGEGSRCLARTEAG